MTDEPTVLMVDAHEGADRIADELRSLGIAVERAEGLEAGLARLDAGGIDVLLLGLDGAPGAFAQAQRHPVEVPIVVATSAEGADRGADALRAGAEDRLVHGEIPEGLAPRVLRYAVEHHRLRGELRALEIADTATGLPTLRGFTPIAEHHLRMADRTKEPVVFLFVRLADVADVADAAAVLREAVRDADVPARIGEDTFCVLLTGSAKGAEATVLSRLIEAIAVANARPDRVAPLSLDVGTTLYDPEEPAMLEEILAEASDRLGQREA